MKSTSRRAFLAAGLTLPAAARGAVRPVQGPATAPQTLKSAKPPEIRYRTLGKTGLKISSVGFGCMITSDPSVIQRAVDMGINHYDTARVYQRGNNEHMVGAVLKPRRKDIILASKTLGSDKQAALKNLEESLAALSTDYLDIWYLHDKKKPGDITDDLIDAQQTAKKQGKIRFAGLSFHAGHADLIPAVIQNGKIDVVLLTYNFAMGDRWDSLIKSLDDAKIGVIAMKVIAGSFPVDASYDYRRTREQLKRAGAPLAALKWVLKNPHVHCAIPSIKDNDELQDNAQAMAVPFADSDQTLLSAQLDYIRPLYCRMCGECNGKCAKGVPVADVLRFLTYAEGYGEYALGREHFLALSERIRGVRCGDCATCTVECPHGVQVATRLSRAQSLFA